jgi:hypothetical protein
LRNLIAQAGRVNFFILMDTINDVYSHAPQSSAFALTTKHGLYFARAAFTRWSSRLVGTPSENPPELPAQLAHVACSSQRVPNSRDL